MSSVTIEKLFEWVDFVNSDTEARVETEPTPKYSICTLLALIPVIAGANIWHTLTNRTARKPQQNLVFLVKSSRFDAETRRSLKTVGDFYTLDGVAIMQRFALPHFAILYELLLHCKRNPGWILLLTKLWLDFCVSSAKHLQGRTFVIEQDFRGRDGILCQLKPIIDCKVICLPHGLISRWAVTTYGAFPGMWSDVALAYELETAEAMKDVVKKIGLQLANSPKVFEFGPLCFCNKSKARVVRARYRLILISSALEAYVNPDLILNSIETAASAADCDLQVRWHPHERESLRIRYPYSENVEEKHALLTSEEPIIFIGMFSTFLYEADSMGFKTIWLTDLKLKKGEPPCVPKNLVNGVECRLDKLDGMVIESVKASSIKSPAFSPVVERLANIIRLSA